MVREVITGVLNQYDLTICRQSKNLTVEKWREIYDFQEGDEGFASQTDKFIYRKFWNPVNPKDGFAVLDCEDIQAKRMLEFLIPILYPEKPS